MGIKNLVKVDEAKMHDMSVQEKFNSTFKQIITMFCIAVAILAVTLIIAVAAVWVLVSPTVTVIVALPLAIPVRVIVVPLNDAVTLLLSEDATDNVPPEFDVIVTVDVVPVVPLIVTLLVESVIYPACFVVELTLIALLVAR